MENIKTIARVFDEKNMLTMEELIFKLEYSERKIRYLLKKLRLVGKDNGFAIDRLEIKAIF